MQRAPSGMATRRVPAQCLPLVHLKALHSIDQLLAFELWPLFLGEHDSSSAVPAVCSSRVME